MRTLHSMAIWTAAVSLATGATCIAVILSGMNPRSYVLLTAEAAAAIGVVSLLVSVLALGLRARRQPLIQPAPWGATGNLPAGDCAACLHKRREVLDQRLDIDEPRLCSQYLIACTCWSFCAESKGGRSVAQAERSVAHATSPAAPEPVCMRNVDSEATVLPLVHRNGMDSCPFRFASPDARSAPAG